MAQSSHPSPHPRRHPPPHPFGGKRVAVVMGGLSAEREVSLNTGAGVLAALLERGWDAVAIDWREGMSVARMLEATGAGVVWNALHGTWGEDGALQGLSACLRIPCTGSGILASALAMDKVMSKRIFESNSVPTPRFRVLSHEGPADGSDAPVALADWPLPCVVKPANEGSSVGVSIVEDASELAPAVAAARTFHGPVIVEDYIAGTEVFVGILNGVVLGSVEVRPATKFYDYEAKYKRTDTKYLIPPELSPDVIARCERLGLAAYTALGCSGHARPDLRITVSGEAFVLEVNTLPGMTATSLLPKIAKSVGMDYGTLCEEILASATTI